MRIRALFIALSVILCWPSHADAQIYAWRDANGTLVLSDRKQDPVARTYAVPGASTIRSTRPAAPPPIRGQFEPLIQEYARQHGLRPDLVRAVIQVESGFNPRALSRKGAVGLMQLMPATARELGVRDAYDPEDNIRGGALYLRQLLDRYDGNEELALAAYNAGFGAVDRHGGQIPPFRETRDYVKKVGSVARLEGVPHVSDVPEASAPDVPGVSAAPASRKRIFYKSVQIVDARPVIRLSTERPTSGVYEVIER